MNRRSLVTLSPTDAYVVEFQRRLAALLASRFRHDADDIAQHEAERLCRRVGEIMAAYPSATVYANVRAGHATQDHLKRAAVQRGEGARGGRSVISGDAVVDADSGVSLFDVHQPAGLALEEEVIMRAESERLVRQAMLRLPADQARVIALVDGLGYSVTEAADSLGIARETASRKHSRALWAAASALASAA